MTCELCILVAGCFKTKVHYRNQLVTVVDCLACNIPMLVFNHCGEATEDERRQAENIIGELFTYSKIRKEAKKILDHEHWHIYGSALRV